MTQAVDLYELMAARRMCRAYQAEPVPRSTLQRVLDAARKTPSAGHSQGVRFGVVRSDQQRLRIAQALDEGKFLAKGLPNWFSGAPVHVFVGSSPSAYQERYREPDKRTAPELWPVDYGVLDAGKALMALYLAAEREGLACGYLGPHRAGSALALVPWPLEWMFLGLVTLGFPDHARNPRSRSHARGWREFDSVVSWWDEETGS